MCPCLLPGLIMLLVLPFSWCVSWLASIIFVWASFSCIMEQIFLKEGLRASFAKVCFQSTLVLRAALWQKVYVYMILMINKADYILLVKTHSTHQHIKFSEQSCRKKKSIVALFDPAFLKIIWLHSFMCACMRIRKITVNTLRHRGSAECAWSSALLNDSE